MHGMQGVGVEYYGCSLVLELVDRLVMNPMSLIQPRRLDFMVRMLGFGVAAVAFVSVGGAALADGGSGRVAKGDASPHPLMKILADELSYNMEKLKTEDGTAPYYLNYTVYDEQKAIIGASLGALTQDVAERDRHLNIEARVGDYSLDNTRQLRGGGRSHAAGSGNVPLAIDDNVASIRHALWFHTDRIFKRSVKRLDRVKTNLKVKVEEEDKSDDFSREEAHVFHQEPVGLDLDRESWKRRVRRISAIAREFPKIYGSNVILGTYAGNRYLVSSEGARVQTSSTRFRITLDASTTAEDGMQLGQAFHFNASSEAGLPDDKVVADAFRTVIDQVLALRDAPIAEPYIGPAILRNRASAVFFHEVFGHRIEGHRQKDVTEGQTFTKKIGQPVLPSFVSVLDDPTRRTQDGVDLRGFFQFDDEGVQAQQTILVDNGILKSFLLSRSPVEGFPSSNGHGRRQPGFPVVSRQGNLIVESSKQVSYDELRRLLIEEVKKQDRPYGLLFEDISGGFTTTSRRGPQSFKVLPIVVYRVFPDGRADELIRGADIVGTPLTCFERILYTADDPAVFNGSCGAESGWVPVSAVSPSILVSTIEIEKRTRGQDRPPILPPPLEDSETAPSGADTD